MMVSAAIRGLCTTLLLVLCAGCCTVRGQAPEFQSCVGEIFRQPNAGQNEATVYWAIPLADDQNGNPAAVTCDPPSGSAFSGGFNPITCTAVDTKSQDETATCTFAVRVYPTFSRGCPSDIVQEDPEVTFTPPLGNFDPSGTRAPVQCTKASVDTFEPGATPVTCTATYNDGNTDFIATCSFIVTTGTLPEFEDLGSCNGSAVVNVAPDDGGNTATAITGKWTRPSSMGGGDATCDPDPDTATFDSEGGNTEVTCTIANNTTPTLINTCTFTVRVFPMFPSGCPDTIVQENGTTVVITPPVATDSAGSAVDSVCDMTSEDTFLDGETTVTCSATDSVETSQVANCSFIVAIGVVPEFEELGSCGASPVNVAPDDGVMTATAITGQWTKPTKAGGGAVTCDPDPDTAIFAGGETQVTCTIQDDDAPSIVNTCTFTVRVFPAFELADAPGEVFRSPDSGANNATFAWLTPTATDMDGEDVAVACDPPSGTRFPGGENDITCEATDSANRTSTYKFKLYVAPTFRTSCPAEDIMQATNPVDFAMPIGDDDPAGVPYPVTCSKNDEEVFDPGETTVTCVARDPVTTLQVTCSFKVTIVVAPTFDDDPPCDEDFNVEPTEGENMATDVVWPERTATQQDGQPATVFCEPISGSDFEAGDTNVTCMAVDNRLPAPTAPTATCDFRVRVYPTFATGCPPDLLAVADPTEDTTIVNFTVPVGAIDSGGLEPADVVCDPESGSAFPNDNVTVVICLASDSITDGVATCNFTVAFPEAPIFDVTPACDEDLNIPPSPGANKAMDVGWPDRTATQDNGEPAIVTCEPVPRADFDGGDTTVSCTATDNRLPELTTTCDFIVHVYPTFVTGCPADKTVNPSTGETTVVDFEVPEGAPDSLGVPANVTCVPDTGTPFPNSEVTEVTCNATDSDADTFPIAAVCTFEVTVGDAPTFDQGCPSESIIEGPNADGEAVVFWEEVTGNTDSTGEPAEVRCDYESGSTFSDTKTLVTCTATDAATGLTANCSFLVIIDSKPPTLECPDDVDVAADAGTNTATFGWNLTAVTDLYTPAEDIRTVCIPSSPFIFQYGRTQVFCAAIDLVNNVRTCSFYVEVTGAACNETCPANSNCTLQENGEPMCVCDRGYAGAECTNEDECDSNPCHADATCTDLEPPDFFSCECEAGFYGDGMYSCERYVPAVYPDIPLLDGTQELEKIFFVEIAITANSAGGCDPSADKMSLECLALVITFRELVSPLYKMVSSNGFNGVRINQTDIRKGSVIVPHTVAYNYSDEEVRAIQVQQFYADSVQSYVDAGSIDSLQIARDCTECAPPREITNVCSSADKEAIACPAKLRLVEEKNDSTGLCIFKCVSTCEDDPEYCNKGTCSQEAGQDAVCSACPDNTELPRCTPVDPEDPEDEGPNIPLIVGLSVGLGGAVLLIIVLNILYCVCRGRKTKDPEEAEGGKDNSAFKMEQRYVVNR